MQYKINTVNEEKFQAAINNSFESCTKLPEVLNCPIKNV